MPLPEARTLRVGTYRVTDPVFAKAPYQGRTRVSGKVVRSEETREVPAGSLWVPLDDEQRKTLRKHFDNQEGEAWSEAQVWTEVSASYVDPQLRKAMEILEGELVMRKLRGR